MKKLFGITVCDRCLPNLKQAKYHIEIKTEFVFSLYTNIDLCAIHFNSDIRILFEKKNQYDLVHVNVEVIK